MNHLKRTPEERAALLAHLRKNYVYEPEGRIRYKGRDKPRMGNSRKPTGRNKNPYLQMTFAVDGVRHWIFYQQAVWLVCKGRWPEGQLDHLNGNKHDNRIENLRVVSMTDNNLNMLLPWEPNKDTGVAGVVFDQGLYRTKIHGRFMSFHDPYEAFYWAIVCGKRYQPTPSPSQRGGELSRARKQ
jgi:hypothetical protein